MITKINFLHEQIKNEGVAFVDTEVLQSIMELKEFFRPEIVKEVEEILQLPSDHKERELRFINFCQKNM